MGPGYSGDLNISLLPNPATFLIYALWIFVNFVSPMENAPAHPSSSDLLFSKHQK